MRDYVHWATLGALCEFLPQAGNRVTLADETDRHGLPVAHFSYSQCDNDTRLLAAAQKSMEEILRAAGAREVMTIQRFAHLVGGARMAARREDGVVDADHRVFGVAGLHVVDGSTLPDPGLGEPGADHHGAGRAGRRPADRRRALRPGTRGGVVTTAVDAPVTDVRTAVYRFPTPTPEADGTFAWDATTVVTAEVVAGGRTGLGWTYSAPAAAALVDGELASAVRGLDALDVPGAWAAMHRAGRNLGTRGLYAQALSAVDIALWDLKARLLETPLADVFGRMRDRVPVYGSGGFTTFDDAQLTAQVEGWQAAGCTAMKIKIGESWGDEARARPAAGEPVARARRRRRRAHGGRQRRLHRRPGPSRRRRARRAGRRVVRGAGQQ